MSWRSLSPGTSMTKIEESPREGNVQVVVRVRPASASESSPAPAVEVRGPKDLLVRCHNSSASPRLDSASRPFHFDHVLGPDAGQEAVFTRVGKPVVDNCLAGYNSTVLAYGQTGSGKTHTMLGECCSSVSTGSTPPSHSTPKTPSSTGLHACSPNPSSGHIRSRGDSCSESPYTPAEEEVVLTDGAGLTPRVFDYLFHRIAAISASEPGTSFVVRASFYEIYNEVIIDLLGRGSNLAIRQNLRSGTVFVEGVVQSEVYGLSDVMSLITRGLANRTVAETQMNATSSRSHSILSCVIESKTMEDGVGRLKAATLNLVDLAGSERQARTAAAGLRLKEASSINKSLSTLGHVIMSLVQGSSHVPYRDSKLTHILQDSLGGNAKAVMIAAVSPTQQNASETESTLGFAARARRMKNNAVVNEDAVGDVSQLRKENLRLRKELEAYRTLETTKLASQAVQENERLRSELAAALAASEAGDSKSSSCSNTPAVDFAAVEADSAFKLWERDTALELLERQLKEVLETNVLLEKRVDELSESNSRLRSKQASLSMENSALRISAELVAEFNAAFQRATAEADKANARVAELEAEIEETADRARYERHASREEMLDKELLLQEFSELTKMLAEAVRERDQAISDRDAALSQKLNISRRKQHAEEQLDDLIRKKTAMQEELSSILDGEKSTEKEGMRTGGVAEDNTDSSVCGGNENNDPNGVTQPPAQESKDPFLRIIIKKLEGMERTRSASLPGTPTACGSPPPQRLGTPRSALVSVLRERDAAVAELEVLKREHTKALHALELAGLKCPPGGVHGKLSSEAIPPMFSAFLDVDNITPTKC